jgi:hypothetical protein
MADSKHTAIRAIYTTLRDSTGKSGKCGRSLIRSERPNKSANVWLFVAKTVSMPFEADLLRERRAPARTAAFDSRRGVRGSGSP